MNRYLMVVLSFIAVLSPGAAYGDVSNAIFNCGFEKIQGAFVKLEGNYRFLDGVRGRCLEYDGYTTKVTGIIGGSVKISDGFTVGAWIAPQVYPWNRCSIVEQSDGKRGFLFSVEAEGYLSFKTRIGGEWVKCVSQNKLELLKWSHIAGVYDRGFGLRIFINGVEAAQSRVTGEFEQAKDFGNTKAETTEAGRVLIGYSSKKMAPKNSERGPSRKILSDIVWDGLIDEVVIFDKVLTAEQISQAFKRSKPEDIKPLTHRRLPSGPAGQSDYFGARYCKLTYAPSWDRLWRIGDSADILVTFDESPVRVVFWHGTNYGACWVTENQIWMGDQSLETDSIYGDCAEHMGDKRCEMSSVRVIENTDARVVIHWRYALRDIRGGIANVDVMSQWGDWADEYYYIYPDAVCVRKQTLWSSSFNKPWHQYQETIFFNQPGTSPEDNIDLDALTLVNMAGQSRTYSWADGPPRAYPEPANANIQLTNLKSEYKPFLIFEPGSRIGPFPYAVRRNWSHFPWWNHWPVGQIANDGRQVTGPDRPSHSSLTVGVLAVTRTSGNDPNHRENYIFKKMTAPIRGEGIDHTALTLCGMTSDKAEQLVPMAKSWLEPAGLVVKSQGYGNSRYSRDERAYYIDRESETSDKLEFVVNSSKDKAAINPCFIIKNWGRRESLFKINGKRVRPGRDLRIGYNKCVKGVDLVLWLKIVSQKPVKIEIERQAE